MAFSLAYVTRLSPVKLFTAFTFETTGFHRGHDNANGLSVTALHRSGPLDFAPFLTTRKPSSPCSAYLWVTRLDGIIIFTIDAWYLRTSENCSRHAVRHTAPGLGSLGEHLFDRLWGAIRLQRTVSARGK